MPKSTTFRTVIRDFESVPDTRLPTTVRGELLQRRSMDTVVGIPAPGAAPPRPADHENKNRPPIDIPRRPQHRRPVRWPARDSSTIFANDLTRPPAVDAPQARQPLPPQYEIARYRIESQLGEGGFAITYRAIDLNLQRPVALKELFLGTHCLRDNNQHVRARDISTAEKAFAWASFYFSKEARITAEMRHDSIVRLTDYFKTNGTSYIVYEMLNGADLQSVAQQRKHGFSQSEVQDMMRVSADALLYVHERGYLHRDIKPSNIFIDGRTRRPILIDFGSACEIDRMERTELTAVSDGFSPPELYDDGAPSDRRSDIYSLAATMYWAITGLRPPAGNVRRANDELKLLKTRIEPDFRMSERMCRVIETGMSPDPEKRYPSVEALLDDLFPKVMLASSGYEARPRGDKVFLSYRREESNHFSGRLLDYLEMRFGGGSVFFDVESIPAGIDFWDHIKSNLQRCAVLVVVMGPDWLDILKARRRRWYRLQRPVDFVAAEINAAIEMQLPILPVLFGGATMPRLSDLPQEMRQIIGLNAAIVGDGKLFRQGADAVCDQIASIKASLHAPPGA